MQVVDTGKEPTSTRSTGRHRSDAVTPAASDDFDAPGPLNFIVDEGVMATISGTFSGAGRDDLPACAAATSPRDTDTCRTERGREQQQPTRPQPR